MPEKRKPRKCSSCNGKGTKTYWTTDKNGKRISYEATCNVCNGTGETY